jgi:hypothetical protein
VAVDILKDSVASQGRIVPSTVQESVVLSGQHALAAVLYAVSLAVLYRFTHRFTAMFLILGGALAGQFLFT